MSPETVATLLALVLSAGNVLIAIGRSRARRAEADTHALEVAVRLAERVPGLEQQLRLAAVQLQAARAEALENKTKIQELRQIIAAQAEAIRRLRQEKDFLATELNEFRTTLQSFEAGWANWGKRGETKS